jgi:urea transport system substrate-binding protein
MSEQPRDPEAPAPLRIRLGDDVPAQDPRPAPQNGPAPHNASDADSLFLGAGEAPDPGLQPNPNEVGRVTRRVEGRIEPVGVQIRQVVSGYEILEEIGRGGMGVVFRARQTGLDREVAIKMIQLGGSLSRAAIARFEMEATAVARLSHPNIVRVYDVGEVDGFPYLVLEYIRGGGLDGHLKGAPLPVRVAADVIMRLARAIHYAHQQGIIHRDLKPSNILLQPRPNESTPPGPAHPVASMDPKVTDFGLAKQMGEDEHLTGSGAVLGTPCYMAPEQARGQGDRISPATDVYGLGAILYETLTGEPPFRGTTSIEIIQRVATVPPIAPRRLRPDLPVDLETICLKCLQKEPGQRYGTALELAADLNRFLQGDSIAVKVRRQPAMSRRYWLAGVGGAGIAGSLGILWAGRGPTAMAQRPPLRVGILQSFTGAFRANSAAVADALYLAIEDINFWGGVLGRRLEAVLGDSRGSDELFLSEAERLLAREHVDVIAGGWTTANYRTIIPLCERYARFYLNPTPHIGMQPSDYMIDVGPAPNQHIIPALDWATSLERRRVYLVGSDTLYARVAHEVAQDVFDRMAITVAGEVFVRPGNVDGLGQRIAAAKPDLILNFLAGDAHVRFFRDLRSANVSSDATPTLSFALGEVDLQQIGLEYMAGDYAAASYFQSSLHPANAAFLQRLHERFGDYRSADDAMETAYVGLHLWAQAVNAAGAAEAAAVRRAWETQHFDGPGGLTVTNGSRLSTLRAPRVGQIQADGQFRVVTEGESLAATAYPATRTPAEWDVVVRDLERQR